MKLDADVLLAYFDRTADGHWSVAGEIDFFATFGQLLVSPFVVVQLEAMVLERFGVTGWLVVLDELAGGAWTIATIDAAHLGAVRDRVEAGEALAEASVAVLAGGAS